jgi:hypothetical protein
MTTSGEKSDGVRVVDARGCGSDPDRNCFGICFHFGPEGVEMTKFINGFVLAFLLIGFPLLIQTWEKIVALPGALSSLEYRVQNHGLVLLDLVDFPGGAE